MATHPPRILIAHASSGTETDHEADLNEAEEESVLYRDLDCTVVPGRLDRVKNPIKKPNN